MEREWLERELAAGRSIEAIAREVGRDPSTVAYWVNKHGLTSQHAPKHAARGGIACEAACAGVVAAGPVGAHDRGRAGVSSYDGAPLALAGTSSQTAGALARRRQALEARTRPVRRMSASRVDTSSPDGQSAAIAARVAAPGSVSARGGVSRRRSSSRSGRRLRALRLRPLRRARCSSTTSIRRRRSSQIAGRGLTRSLDQLAQRRGNASCSARTATRRSRAGFATLLRVCRPIIPGSTTA